MADTAEFVDAELGAVRSRFREFLDAYEHPGFEGDAGQTLYRAAIAEMLAARETTLVVSFTHIHAFDDMLASALQAQFYRFQPALGDALRAVVGDVEPQQLFTAANQPRDFFVSVAGPAASYKIHQLRSSMVGTLLQVSGTVTRANQLRPELLRGTFRCAQAGCGQVMADVPQQFRFTEPPICANPECQNRTNWELVVERSKFGDFQRVRLQESGGVTSSPPSLDVILRGALVDSLKPGDRALVAGFLAVVPSMTQRQQKPGDEGVGGFGGLVQEVAYRMVLCASHVRLAAQQDPPAAAAGGPRALLPPPCPVRSVLGGETPAEVVEALSGAERAALQRMLRDRHLYARLVRSFAPFVHGSDAVKKGLLLMLMGGVPKATREGIRLRGDINVLIVGDPSTAKSQMLKYVSQFHQRGVYTSGKAATAAGLTASVVMDAETREFSVEAGAMMLADNGICCIDEFEKMSPQDQSAIHEAMEQQTISISKAGINATLNARTSVLAAMNPIGGRYDPARTLAQNVAVNAPILSRFDLFFILRDVPNPVMDRHIAERIVALHGARAAATAVPYTLRELQAFIRFARTLRPTLSDAASAEIARSYARLRQEDSGSLGRSYRMTVRQLESLVRLSEALAKLHGHDEIARAHVEEARALLQTSNIVVEGRRVMLGGLGGDESSESEPLDLDAGGDGDPYTLPPATKQAAQRAVRNVEVTYDTYARYARLAVLYIRERMAGGGAEGVRQGDVTEHLLTVSRVAQDERADRARVVALILRRLIVNDRILVCVRDEPRGAAEAERLLDVHPQYEP